MNIVSKVLLVLLLPLVISCEPASLFKSGGQAMKSLQDSFRKGENAFLSKDSERRVVDGNLEPLEPVKEENNKTIAGIDTNNDGLRDDIERMINRKFPGDGYLNYNYRNAFKQVMRNKQKVMVEADSKESAREYMREYLLSKQCLAYVYCYLFPGRDLECVPKYSKIRKILSPKLLNTSIRKDKWEFVDKAMAGSMSISLKVKDKRKSCKFKIRSE